MGRCPWRPNTPPLLVKDPDQWGSEAILRGCAGDTADSVVPSVAMPSSTLCFLLVDDHALFRAGLGMMLGENWPMAQLAHAATWDEALVSLKAQCPDLILLDVHLPDAHSVARLAELREAAPGCPVLMLSSDVARDQVDQARVAGAAGFLPKSAPAAQVKAAVAACLRGDQAYDALPYDVLLAADHAMGAGAVTQVSESLRPALTPRQLAILRYLGSRTPNKAIARQMEMSELAVRAEVSWLTECLQATSRQQAFDEAVARGLLVP